MAGLARLVHPFPTLLDGLATAGLAVIAGASGITAIRLGAAMVAFQSGIGALNDVRDAPADRAAKPRKPIPAGLISPASAIATAVAAFAIGVVLSAPSGLPTVIVGLIGAAIGVAYDLRLKGTSWSWLPFALGIPLLPVYAWLGATGSIPGWFAVLVPAAVAAGAALAIGNALADIDRDAASGTDSIAVRLGPTRAWFAHACLHALVAIVGVASLLAVERGAALVPAVAGVACIGAGVALSGRPDAHARERGWEIEAIGTAALALGWVAGMATLPA